MTQLPSTFRALGERSGSEPGNPAPATASSPNADAADIVDPGWVSLASGGIAVPADWHAWLASRDSLTERLIEAAGAGHFRVRLLAEAKGLPWPDEAHVLGLASDEQAWLREVALCVDEAPWVVARSVAPIVERHDAPFEGLGETSLGSWLFRQPDLERSAIQIGRNTRPIHGYTGLWQRRSVFRHSGWVLLVQESFMPAMGRALSLAASATA